MTAKPLGQQGEERMVQAIKAVEAILPGYAVALLVAPFGDAPDRRVNYIGNGPREDIRAMMKEVLARWERRYQEAKGRAQ